jgi:sugar phosphate isomerase/epimerase
LREPIDDLLARAEKFDMKLHAENEGVCNIAGHAELEALVTAYRHPRLRALPDIANAYRAGLPPSAADLVGLLPFTDILHFKDYANAARRFVALGDRDIPFAAQLVATLPEHDAPLDADHRDACPLGAGPHPLPKAGVEQEDASSSSGRL